MKKLTLLTCAAVSLTAFGGMSLTAEAAPVVQSPYNNVTVITGNSMEELKEKLNELKDQMPNIDWDNICPPSWEQPDAVPPQTPDAEQPDVPDTETPDAPETEAPSPDVPETEAPSPEVPDVPETEAPDLPETEAPDNNNPETPETPDTEQPEEDQQLSYAHQVVSLVNAEREKRGLSPLTIQKDVEAAAMVRAREIQTSFSHTRPDGSSFSTALREQNVSYRGSGENIAWGQRSPQEVMNAWMNSDGHRANILNERFTSIGVGYLQNASGTGYWTQLFTY